ncbi:MAG: hypothetical protein RDU25_06010 [Patescibacteria group bacterium]|nr:hypothetical protein [Patescibacteria group bacterium]
MHSRFIGLVLVVLVAMLAAMGCMPKRNSTTVNTANGHSQCTQTAAGLDCTVDTEKQFRDCMAMHTPQMGNSYADSYCRNVTSGNQLGGARPVVAPGAMPGTGGVVMGGGGHFPGYPASAPIFLPDPTPIGVINTQNNASGGYMLPAPGGAPATGSASDQDVRDLGRSAAAQQAAICRIKPDDPICCPACNAKK